MLTKRTYFTIEIEDEHLKSLVNIVCLSGCLSICLYPINGKTADPIEPKFCVGPRMSPGNVYECSELQKVVCKKKQVSKLCLDKSINSQLN